MFLSQYKHISVYICILYLNHCNEQGGKRDTAESCLASTSWLPGNVGLYEPKWKKKKEKSLCIQNLLGANLAWQWDESWIHASFNSRGLECSLLSTEIKQFTGNRLLSTSRSAK